MNEQIIEIDEEGNVVGAKQKLICGVAGHLWVSGRGFLLKETQIDLKWQGCARCGKWKVEGGLGKIIREYDAVQP